MSLVFAAILQLQTWIDGYFDEINTLCNSHLCNSHLCVLFEYTLRCMNLNFTSQEISYASLGEAQES